MVYVIQDSEGNFVSPRKTDSGWMFVKFTGKAMGFVYYTKKETTEKEMEKVDYKKNGFKLNYIKLRQIPEGKRV